MSNFYTAFSATMAIEGSYANDPADTGGETYAGVSRRNWPAWNGWVVVDELKNVPNFPRNLNQNPTLQNLVESFYKLNFWDALKLDSFPNQPIATELYDLAVNCGTGVAAEFLQRSLNVLNNNGGLFSDLVIDGQIGAATLAAVPLCNPLDLLGCIVSLQGAKYIAICEKNHNQEKFMKSWIRRAYSRYILK